MYHIDNGMWGRVFAVPNDIADKHIKLCGAVSLKVLLLLLRHGEPLSAGRLASMLAQSPADIQDAANYWVELGIIGRGNIADREEQPAAVTAPAAAAAPVTANASAPVHTSEELPGGNRLIRVGRPMRLTRSEINDLAESDSRVRNLLSEAQIMLGRPLKSLEPESIVTVYARFEFPADIVLMMMNYCISIGKTISAQLEKTAADWYNRGIDTHEKAEQELMRLCTQEKTDNSIRTAFGVYGRGITDKERIFFTRWTDEWRMDIPLIRAVYEHSVTVKGKYDITYMDSVLKDLWGKGVKTPEAAARELEGYAQKPPKGKQHSEPKASYDIGRFEEILSNTSIWD
ncbi:MAG: DnaD domain protein [Oscillospiraceae bacterium]|nr:DnaD domain protein [Oscillospiraceae bacterium]